MATPQRAAQPRQRLFCLSARRLVNTHAKGDHTFGNQLVTGPGISPRAVTVASLYCEFGSRQELGIMELFAEMGRFHVERKHAHGHQHAY